MLIEYSVSAFITVSSSLLVRPLPIVKMFFFLLSACADVLLSLPQDNNDFPNSRLAKNKGDPASNLMSALLTATNKQSPNVKWAPWFYGQVSNS